MKGPGKGRPKSLAFEHQVRTILASGCSARAAQDHVLSSARVYLTSAAFAEYEQHVPNIRWYNPSTPNPNATSTPKQYPQHTFQHQREAPGGGTAIEICEHVEETWATGQRSSDLLREELGGEAEALMAVEGGGVKLHKIRGVMHDTCAT
jgi:hypothetical protein